MIRKQDKYEHKKRSDVLREKESSEKTRKGRKHQKKPKSFERLNAEKGRFNYDTINGFRLIDVEYTVPDKKTRKRRRSGFDSVRKEFLKHIAANFEKELRAIGVTDKQLEQMAKGGCPTGYNVHHKLPIHGGGMNEFKNLILMPIRPHDELHHRVLDPQVSQMQAGESKTVKLPWSDNMVYVPPENDNSNVQGKKQGNKKDPTIIDFVPTYVKTATAARR